MRKILFAFILLFQLDSFVTAQVNNADSLKNDILRTDNDTMRLVLYSLLGNLYQISYDSSLMYTRKAFSIAEKLNLKLDQAYTLDIIGYDMYHLNNPAALEILLEGVKLAEDIANEKNILPEKYWNKIVYFDEMALPKDRRSPANVRFQILASLYQDMGHVYGDELHDWHKQLYYYSKAINIALSIDDSYTLMLNYNTSADTYRLLGQLDSALLYVKKAYNIAIASGVEEWTIHPCSILGNVYFEQGNFSLAIHFLQQAIKTGLKYNVNLGMIPSYLTMSDIYFKMHSIDSSFLNAKLAYKEAIQTNSPQFILLTTQKLSELYAATNNLDSAYKYLLASYNLKDSVQSSEKIKQIEALDFDERMHQKETAQKLQEAQLKYTNILKLYLLSGALLVVLLIAAGLWRKNVYKQKSFTLLQKQKHEIDNQKSKVEQTLDELRNTQSQLIQSEKMASLGELTAGIAHEIQNPLNFVNNFSEVNKELLLEMNDEIDKGNLSEVKSIAKDVIDNEERINHHGKRADAIVKGMLQHSRSSTGVKEPTNINALADEYLRLSYHGLRAKDKSFNANFKTDFDESIGNINIVPQDIGRVLLNLYNNAFYAVTEKAKQKTNGYEPTISVSSKKVNNRVELTVKDNGNGIPQKVVDKIFQPFFTTKPTGEGTGLGLSLSYDIIKAHGGEIKVGTKEGEGSRFIIDLSG